jgi:hypothetical protein
MANSKLPEVPLGFLPENTPQLEAFQGVPKLSSPSQKMLAGPICLMLCGLPGTALVESFPWIKSGGWDSIVMAPFFLVGTWLLVWLMSHASILQMADQEARDKPHFDPVGEHERYVGIAYGETDWVFRGDTSWDRGYVRSDASCLEFRGFGPSFRLPLNRIRAVRCARTGLGSINHLPRIYVDWEHPSGRTNTFSLEIRSARSRSDSNLKTLELAGWLNDFLWERDCFGGDATGGETEVRWPIESSQLDLRFFPRSDLLRLFDRAAALAASLLWTAAMTIVALATRRWAYHSDVIFLEAILFLGALPIYYATLRGIMNLRVRQKVRQDQALRR